TSAVAASVALGVYSFNAETEVLDGASFLALNPDSGESLADGNTSAIVVNSQSYIDSPFLEKKYSKIAYKKTAANAGVLTSGPQGIKQGFTGGPQGADV